MKPSKHIGAVCYLSLIWIPEYSHVLENVEAITLAKKSAAEHFISIAPTVSKLQILLKFWANHNFCSNNGAIVAVGCMRRRVFHLIMSEPKNYLN